LLAIVFDEPEGSDLMRLVGEAPTSRMSSANILEAGIVVDRYRNSAKAQALDALMRTLGVDIESVAPQQAGIARTAYRIYGKGNHPAAMNYGDCFAYALTKATGQRLLFKGQDFFQTAIEIAR
jgi:ribonuclease VapC